MSPNPALAVAYSIKRKNRMAREKAKGYADGGKVDDSFYIEGDDSGDNMGADTSDNTPEFLRGKKPMFKGGMACYSDGGVVSASDKLKKDLQSPMGGENVDSDTAQYLPPDMMKNIAQKIVKKMAMGGMVNSEDALKEAMDYELAKEDYPSGQGDNEMISMDLDTEHDDFLSAEGDESGDDMFNHEDESEEMGKKKMLSNILSRVAARNMGR